MKTLSHLIEEAENRFWQNYTQATDKAGERKLKVENPWILTDFLKTELQTIVKESFKNTRVEKKNCKCEAWEDCCDFAYDDALSDKHNKENQFLNN